MNLEENTMNSNGIKEPQEINPNLPGGGGHYGPPPVVFLTVRLFHSKFRALLS